MIAPPSEDKIREELRGNLVKSYGIWHETDRRPVSHLVCVVGAVVLRWKSSDDCIPNDIMLKMKRYGLVDQAAVDATKKGEVADIDAHRYLPRSPGNSIDDQIH